jgi:hypothetical protein
MTAGVNGTVAPLINQAPHREDIGINVNVVAHLFFQNGTSSCKNAVSLLCKYLYDECVNFSFSWSQ